MFTSIMFIYDDIRVESTIYTKLIPVCFTVNKYYYRYTRSCTMPHRGLKQIIWGACPRTPLALRMVSPCAACRFAPCKFQNLKKIVIAWSPTCQILTTPLSRLVELPNSDDQIRSDNWLRLCLHNGASRFFYVYFYCFLSFFICRSLDLHIRYRCSFFL